MVSFNKDQIEYFLAVVRKYMQLRGALSQKDLAEKIDVGISTLSRFLGQKTKEIDEQTVARLVAYLQIPLHEMIEFVVESDTDNFKKIVSIYKDELQKKAKEQSMIAAAPIFSHEQESVEAKAVKGFLAQQDATRSNVFFQQDAQTESRMKHLEEFRDRVQKLSPRQRAYITDFLDLDIEGKEMVVEVGEVVMRYFKGKKMNF